MGPDWTSVSQVGALVGDQRLSAAEYIRVETNYIETLTAILAEGNATQFRLLDVEVYARHAIPGLPTIPTPAELAALAHAPARGDLVSLVARACLREELWCRLVATDASCEVHFGYDYYLYVTGLQPSRNVVLTARATGIFVEEFASPYSAG